MAHATPIKFDCTDIRKVSKEIDHYGGPATLTVSYGTHKIGSQIAYVSVTAEVWRKNANDCESCGQLHTEVLEHFPELADLVRLHLVSVDGTPMHYVANAKFWWEIARGEKTDKYQTAEKAAEHYRSTVVAGVLESDEELPVPEGNFGWGDAEAALESRRPALRAHTHEVLERFLPEAE